ncbi:N(4)-(Beta-N-acetylglucosaminyl)-L-asparaginase-like [Saccostrea echinata]|uniref:N(4)-(Beta-N-acetylglucosaminyl)-L-asparaginase- like n=1 Tax=Saccostrea echinata TaxID=191078 RepID=UPI002A836F9D|nr:N(4)-(Beta-N-acetylglucosaminyl)-L-asparaginase-like [Saccostrea echinata]
MDLIIGTWSFCFDAIRQKEEFYRSEISCLDAVENTISQIEGDESYGPCIVGRGGPPNSAGYREYDAAIMDGRTSKFGAVTALRGIPQAVSVARAVMERSRHSMLTGEGAGQFALENGFHAECETPHQSIIPENDSKGHDTLGLIAQRKNEPEIAVGVSTSGAPGKHPGRVGDSALPGGGLYANSHGAACCSGDGDEILKFCASFHIVHLISQGRLPQEACTEVIQKIYNQNNHLEIAVIASDIKGNYGACSTVRSWTDPLTQKHYEGFPYVLWTKDMTCPEIRLATTVS